MLKMLFYRYVLFLLENAKYVCAEDCYLDMYVSGTKVTINSTLLSISEWKAEGISPFYFDSFIMLRDI